MHLCRTIVCGFNTSLVHHGLGLSELWIFWGMHCMHVLLKVLDAKIDTLTTGSGDQGPKSAAASRQAARPAVGIAACLILLSQEVQDHYQHPPCWLGIDVAIPRC
jgi:hypothetical protein